MKLEKSQKDLLYLLLKQEEETSLTKIQSELHISRRTVYYNVNKLNEFLFGFGINPVNNRRGEGYYLTEEQKKVIQEVIEIEQSVYNLTPDERVQYLVCWLMYPKEKVFIEDIIVAFDISRNSVFNDLKVVKSAIEKYDLSLEFDLKNGYSIAGQVFGKRALLLYYLKILLKKLSYKSIDFLNAIEVEDFYARLQRISLNMRNEYDGFNLLAIACVLNIVHFVDERFDFSILELRDLENTDELRMIDQYFEDLNVHERLYLTIHLLGSKASSVIHIENGQKDIQLFELAQHLVELFERQTLIELSEKNELVNSLYMHFKLSMYYYQLSIQISNILLEAVKINYESLYQLIKSICESIQDEFPFILTDSEISYITMHFGGHQRKMRSKYYAPIRVLVVCPSGISTSTLLKKEVEDLYANVTVVAATTANNIYQYDGEIDFIVSTIDLDTNIPWIKVNAILEKEDKAKIASMISMNVETYQLNGENLNGLFSILGKYVNEGQMENLRRDIYEYFRNGHYVVETKENDQLRLKDILTVDNVIRVNKNVVWKEAIKIASEPLLITKSITSKYVQAMIDLVEEHGAYIVLKNKIAIAHAKPEEGANRLNVSLLINRKKIYFDEKIGVHFLFVLSSPNPKAHLQILKDISFWTDEEVDLTTLLNGDINELMNCVRKIYQ
ncbi:PTS sugar transporter subunit IIA [uncultured Solobacterium sp.]|uniref:BglG family transcription antiterminator n=1 Tax=uncultured Solobacterium sp. TaxID=747375 RepID=UPI0028E7971D|nr:PTS sugar transporter subunit IIA [uncultured Solobacterium sp.]